MLQILVASRNAKKLRELHRVLHAAGITDVELLSLRDVPEYPETPETGATFADNALIKARDGVRHTGLPTVADDSGICVDALNGMPGVLSARWCGKHGEDATNNALLLGQLADVPEERRGAHYISVCALALPADLATAVGLPEETTVEGVWHGTLRTEPRGEEGFGYDPLFSPEEEPGTTVAELSAERKDELSHRGKALAQLVEPLKQLAAARKL
ncbi:non-canonical purine NTP pyrophosphatase [Corynebacterium heidelbergense]|uniref:dITP/XTP pyrophosphatase n=1 Tax=Corynebacterium heidelbergense TaxID=2055947 RepID=A0A364V7X4_9CORY|nr:non-canonical purine NTP pyrophosphatase [Corynebacterium heidelbergense]RAV32666.1 non-canonical purine NTP pyrophosphatase [Corynebacterium heidelbergense]